MASICSHDLSYRPVKFSSPISVSANPFWLQAKSATSSTKMDAEILVLSNVALNDKSVLNRYAFQTGAIGPAAPVTATNTSLPSTKPSAAASRNDQPFVALGATGFVTACMDSEPFTCVTPTPTIAGTLTIQAVALGIIEGQSKLAVASFDGTSMKRVVDVYGSSDGSYLAEAPTESATTPLIAVRFANLNPKTTDEELITIAPGTTDSSGMVRIYSYMASTKPKKFALSWTINMLNRPLDVAVGDLNGDGLPDLVLPQNDGMAGSLGVVVQQSNGSFPTALSFSSPTAPCQAPAKVALADLNGDGFADAVVPDSGSSQICVMLGNGDGTFAQAKSVMISSPATVPQALSIADLDGDGWNDIVVAATNSIVVLINQTGTASQ